MAMYRNAMIFLSLIAEEEEDEALTVIVTLISIYMQMCYVVQPSLLRFDAPLGHGEAFELWMSYLI
jgi:hypothetical protein